MSTFSHRLPSLAALVGCLGLACGGRISSEGAGGHTGGATATGTTSTAGGTGGTTSGGVGGAGGGESGGAGAGTGGVGGGTSDAGSLGDAATTCPPFPMPAACSQNPAGQVATQTIDAFRAAIAARWVLCGTQSVFGANGGDIGLEITADGHWYKLFAAQGAATMRGAGFDEEGTWDAIVTAPGDIQPFQLNLSIFGSGTVITHPALAANPPAIRLNNNSVFVGNYVLDSSVPVGMVRCTRGPDPTNTGICAPPPETVYRATCTDAAASEAVLGRWSRCGGSMPGAPQHEGVEFAALGGFFFLHRDATGVLVRGTADNDRGMAQALTWGGGSSAPCQMTTTIQTASGASLQSSARPFDSMPRQLWMYTSPEWGDPERYTFIAP